MQENIHHHAWHKLVLEGWLLQELGSHAVICPTVVTNLTRQPSYPKVTGDRWQRKGVLPHCPSSCRSLAQQSRTWFCS